MNFNKAIVVGNIVQDPENRALPDGKSVTTLKVATNRMWSDAAGNKQQSAEYHNIVLFGKLAEISHQYLAKGRLVLIEGRIQTRSWDDAATGIKKYRTEIIAESMQMGPKTGGPQAPTPTQPQGKSISKEKIDLPVINQEDILADEDIEDIPF